MSSTRPKRQSAAQASADLDEDYDDDMPQISASGRPVSKINYNDEVDYGITDSEDGSESSSEEDEFEDTTLRVESVVCRRPLEADATGAPIEAPKVQEDGTIAFMKPDHYEYLIKYAGKSYMHAEWTDHATIVAGGQYLKGMLSRFIKRWIAENGDATIANAIADAGEDEEPDFFDPAYLEVDRIIGMKLADRVEAAEHLIDHDTYEVPAGSKSTVRLVRRRRFLIKWNNLGYSECTWEWEDELDDDVKVSDFLQANRPPLYAALDGNRVDRAQRPWVYKTEDPDHYADALMPSMMNHPPNYNAVAPGGSIGNGQYGGLQAGPVGRARKDKKERSPAARSELPDIVLRAASRAASAVRRPNCGEDPSIAWLNAVHGMPPAWPTTNTLLSTTLDALNKTGEMAWDVARAVCGPGRVSSFHAWLRGAGLLSDGEEARLKAWLRAVGGAHATDADVASGFSVPPRGRRGAPLPPSATGAVANVWDTYTPLRQLQRSAYGVRTTQLPMLARKDATNMALHPHDPSKWPAVKSWPPAVSSAVSEEDIRATLGGKHAAEAAVPTGFQLSSEAEPAHPRVASLATADGAKQAYMLPLSQLAPMLTALAAAGKPLNATQQAFLGLAHGKAPPTAEELGNTAQAAAADLRHAECVAAARKAAEEAAAAAAAAEAAAAEPAPVKEEVISTQPWWEQLSEEELAGDAAPELVEGEVVGGQALTKRQLAAMAAKNQKANEGSGGISAPDAAAEAACSRMADSFPLVVRLRRTAEGSAAPGAPLTRSSGGVLDYTMGGARETWGEISEDTDDGAAQVAAVLDDVLDSVCSGSSYSVLAAMDSDVYKVHTAQELLRVPPTAADSWVVTSALPEAVESAAEAYPLRIRMRLAPAEGATACHGPGQGLALPASRPTQAHILTPAPGHTGESVPVYAANGHGGSWSEWLAPSPAAAAADGVLSILRSAGATAPSDAAKALLQSRDLHRLSCAYLGGVWAPLALPAGYLAKGLPPSVRGNACAPPGYEALYAALDAAWRAIIQRDLDNAFPEEVAVAAHGEQLAQQSADAGAGSAALVQPSAAAGPGFSVEDIHELNGAATRTRRGLRCSFTYAKFASTWIPERDSAPPQPRTPRGMHSFVPYAKSIEYGGGRKLRSYQVEGLNWLLSSYHNRRNVILADEMGLGKTAQTVTFLFHLFKNMGIRGPFLIVAPLSTLQHWKREVDAWASGEMYGVVYHASGAGPGGQRGKDLRSFIRDWEWFYPGYSTNVMKSAVVITTYEVAISDAEFIGAVPWEAVVVDEGHRLRGANSKIKEIMQDMSTRFRLLLTGTPLQNNTKELWSLLHWLEPEKFGTEAEWIENYGTLTTQSQVNRLQADIAPHILRRVKEDVEKSIPKKEETIIDVSLTMLQKQYYRAIFDKNRVFLYRGCSKSNVPALTNIEMQLRKCCNHPYLIEGVEDKDYKDAHEAVLESADKIVAKQEGASGEDASEASKQMAYAQARMDRLIQSSGKLVLLDKLLPKLRAEGHKVLIFSQMVRMLDILEDYCRQKAFLYERLDGSVHGNTRQHAIDRFQNDENRFVFLLSTRAGGVGINLTAADTVIIFDSDWNPQNDIQATARAHRIGQTQEVKVYRLITRNTYEAKMFDRASRKLALDQAVLGVGGPGAAAAAAGKRGGSKPALKPEELEALLRHGAYGILAGDEAEDEESRKFQESSIEDLLARNTRTIEVDATTGKQTGVFKKSFTLDDAKGEGAVDMNADDFWEKVLPGFQSATKLLGRLNGVPSAPAPVSNPDGSKRKRGRKKKSSIGGGTAVADEESREQFMKDVNELVEGLVKSREEQDTNAGGANVMVESEIATARRLLVQVSAMKTFNELQRAQASALLQQLEVQRSRTQVYRSGFQEGAMDELLGGKKRRRDKDDFLGSDISDSESDEEGEGEGEEADESMATTKKKTPAKKPRAASGVPRVPFGFTVPEIDRSAANVDAGARMGSAIAPSVLEEKRIEFWGRLQPLLEQQVADGKLRPFEIKWSPVIGGRPLDLWQLWKEVARFNGYEKACKTTGSWLSMFKRLPNYATSETSSTYRLKTLFAKYLLDLEKLHPPVYEDFRGLGKYKYSRTSYSVELDKAVEARKAEMEATPAGKKAKARRKRKDGEEEDDDDEDDEFRPVERSPDAEPDPVDETWDDDKATESVAQADGSVVKRKVRLQCALCKNAHINSGVEQRIHAWRVHEGIEEPGSAPREDDDTYDEDTGIFLPPFVVATDAEGKPTERLFVHKNCAEQSPEVFQNKKKEYCNVLAAVKRGQELKCAACKQYGATIGCNVRRCNRSYHHKCAMFAGRHGWRFGVQEDAEASMMRAVRQLHEERHGPLDIPSFPEAKKKPAAASVDDVSGTGGDTQDTTASETPVATPQPAALSGAGEGTPMAAAASAAAAASTPAAPVGGRKRPRVSDDEEDERSDTESIVGTVEYFAGSAADGRMFLCPHHRATQLARMAEEESTSRARAAAKETWNASFMSKELAAAKLTGQELPYMPKVRVHITGKWEDYGAAVGAAMVRWVDWDNEKNEEIPGGGKDALQLITAAEAIHPQRLQPDGSVKQPSDEDLGVDANKARLSFRRIVLKAFRHEAGVPDTPAKRPRKSTGGSTGGDDASTATGADNEDDTNMTEGAGDSASAHGDERPSSRADTPASASPTPVAAAGPAAAASMPPPTSTAPAGAVLPSVPTLPGINAAAFNLPQQ